MRVRIGERIRIRMRRSEDNCGEGKVDRIRTPVPEVYFSIMVENGGMSKQPSVMTDRHTYDQGKG
jgi:hypothetical protein